MYMGDPCYGSEGYLILLNAKDKEKAIENYRIIARRLAFMNGKTFVKFLEGEDTHTLLEDEYEFAEGEKSQDIFTKDEYHGKGYYFGFKNLVKLAELEDSDYNQYYDEYDLYCYAIAFFDYLPCRPLDSPIILHSYSSAKTLGKYISWLIKDKVVIMDLKFSEGEYGDCQDNLTVMVDLFENGEEKERISSFLWGDIEGFKADNFEFKIHEEYHPIDDVEWLDVCKPFTQKIINRLNEIAFVPDASLMTEMYGDNDKAVELLDKAESLFEEHPKEREECMKEYNEYKNSHIFDGDLTITYYD